MAYFVDAKKSAQKLHIQGKVASRNASLKRKEELKIQHDPSQSLLLVGKSCKITKVVSTNNSTLPSTLVPWNNQNEILIDRYDVRAFLDYIPKEWENENDGLLPTMLSEKENEDIIIIEHPYSSNDNDDQENHNKRIQDEKINQYEEDNSNLEKLLNYERYRSIVDAHRKLNEIDAFQVEDIHVNNTFLELDVRIEALLTPSSSSSSSSSSQKEDPCNSTNAPLPISNQDQDENIIGHYGRVGYMYHPSHPPSDFLITQDKMKQISSSSLSSDINNDQLKENRKKIRNLNKNDNHHDEKEEEDEFLTIANGIDETKRLSRDVFEGIAASYGISDLPTTTNQDNKNVSLKEKRKEMKMSYEDLLKLDRRMLEFKRASNEFDVSKQQGYRRRHHQDDDQGRRSDHNRYRFEEIDRRRRRSPTYGDKDDDEEESRRRRLTSRSNKDDPNVDNKSKPDVVIEKQFITSFGNDEKKDAQSSNIDDDDDDENENDDKNGLSKMSQSELLVSFFPCLKQEMDQQRRRSLSSESNRLLNQFKRDGGYLRSDRVDDERIRIRRGQLRRSRSWSYERYRSHTNRRSRSRSFDRSRRRSDSRDKHRNRRRSDSRDKHRSRRRSDSRDKHRSRRRSDSRDKHRSRRRSDSRDKHRSRRRSDSRDKNGNHSRSESSSSFSSSTSTASSTSISSKSPSPCTKSSSSYSNPVKTDASSCPRKQMDNISPSTSQSTLVVKPKDMPNTTDKSSSVKSSSKSSAMIKNKVKSAKERLALRTAQLMQQQLEADQAKEKKKRKHEAEEDFQRLQARGSRQDSDEEHYHSSRR